MDTAGQMLYDYTNMSQYLRQRGFSMSDDWLRWLQAVVGTKLGMFRYEGLPEDLLSEDVEKALMFNSQLCWYDSPAVGMGLYKYKPSLQSDKYWHPAKVDLITLRGSPIDINVDYKDIVPMRDNVLDIIPYITVTSWLEKILQVEKTLDMTLLWGRMPFVLSGSKEQVNQYKQLIKKTLNFEPFAIGEKGLVDSVQQFDIHMPLDPLNLFDLMSKYMDKAVESIGIYSADKKAERLITAEVNAQNDYVDFVYQGMFNQRKDSIAKANERYGTHITMIETYVENQQDELHEERLRNEIVEKTKAKYQAEVERVKNEGKIEAARVTGVEASKIEGKNGGKGNGGI